MKMNVMAGLMTLLLCVLATGYAAETVVSTDWLEANLSKVTVVDIRKVEDYRAGHVPAAINAYFGAWVRSKEGLQNELPLDEALREILLATGIEPETRVVVAGSAAGVGENANVTRVAWTLKYAGIDNVAILNGGFEKWVADRKPVSKDIVKLKGKPHRGKLNKTASYLVSKEELLNSIGKAVIVDARDPELYSGAKKASLVERPGHIKGAVNLPTSKAFNEDGTFKTPGELEAMARRAVGNEKTREILVYCDTGRAASVWWYLLSESFGYQNVKLYDGSAQDFAKDPSAPMEQ
jgi:thiosulfate/3-mercaptopyruvate sulfurtransferase